MGFFKDYMIGRALAQNPRILEREYERQAQERQAQERQEFMAGLMGQEATPANYDAQQIQTEGPMMPGQERNLMAVNQLQGMGDQEAVEAQQGTGIRGGNMSPMDMSLALMNAPDKQLRAAGTQSFVDAIKPERDGAFSFQDYQNASPAERAVYDKFKGRSFGGGGSEAPAAVREWQYFNNMTPEKQQQYLQLKRNSPIKDIGTGYMNMVTGQFQPKDIKGKEVTEAKGKAMADKIVSFPKFVQAQQSMLADLGTTKQQLLELKNEANNWKTGAGSLFAGLPYLDPTDFREKISTVKSRLALEKMAELKALSPTGATGFGALSAPELKLLTDHLGSLEQAQSPKAFKRQVDLIVSQLDRLANNSNRALTDSERWYSTNKDRFDRQQTAEPPTSGGAPTRPPPPPGFK